MGRTVTITLDEEVARWARVKAAESEMSLSRLVGAILREKMRRENDFIEAARRRVTFESRPHVFAQKKPEIRQLLHEMYCFLPSPFLALRARLVVPYAIMPDAQSYLF